MKKTMIALAICGALLGTTSRATAATVTVDPSATWLGYMNVFDLPSAGGAFRFGSGWGTADLVATFSGPVLTLAPNSVNDISDYWYLPSGGPGSTGNKNMFASMYVESNGGALGGQSVTFTGRVLSNTFVSPYTVTAFIKDFAPDYSSFTSATALLSATGDFSFSHATAADPARHVQYGFETVGPNVWITDAAAKGSMRIGAIPEPATLALGGLCSLAALVLRRRRA
jgi:uncharacterized protein (TIGR03382 family)